MGARGFLCHSENMQFVVGCSAPRLLALLVVHGVCDVCLIPYVLVYSLCLRPAWNSTFTTGLFAAASLYHFAQDAGWTESVLGHATLATIYVLGPTTSYAFEWMLVYTCVGHIPLLALTMYDSDRLIELFILGVASAVAMAMPFEVLQDVKLITGVDKRKVCITDAHQRIVVLHILCRFLHTSCS